MPGREHPAVKAAGLTAGLAFAAAVVGCSSAPPSNQQVLKIGAIPDQNPERLNRLYGALSDELGASLNVEVQYVPVSNYAAAVSAFRSGSLDLVWFGGLTGVQARLQTPGATVLAQRDIDAEFTSVFIANGASGLRPITSADQLVQLKGRRLAFGSESSTSGRLMPQYFLGENGVTMAELAGGDPVSVAATTPRSPWSRAVPTRWVPSIHRSGRAMSMKAVWIPPRRR